MSSRVLLGSFFVVSASLASAQVQSMALADANGSVASTGFVLGPTATAARSFESPAGYGHAAASAEEGKLHAYAQAFAKAPSADAQLNTVCVTATSSFIDTIHIGGTRGKTTTITLGVRLDGTLVGAGSFAEASFAAGSLGEVDILASTPGAFDQYASVSFEVAEDSDVYVAALLNASATADARWGTGDAFASSDFGHTARFAMRSSDPSVSVIGSGGFNYAQPVPEPGSLCALTLGAGVLARSRRRAKG